jgi:hypothetical protein
MAQEAHDSAIGVGDIGTGLQALHGLFLVTRWFGAHAATACWRLLHTQNTACTLHTYLYLGGSDMALNPQASPLDVWL